MNEEEFWTLDARVSRMERIVGGPSAPAIINVPAKPLPIEKRVEKLETYVDGLISRVDKLEPKVALVAKELGANFKEPAGQAEPWYPFQN